MRPIYHESDLPAPGSIVVATLSDGRFGAGVVLRNEFYEGAQAVLLRVTPWIGSELPALDEPLLRETLILNHHRWQNHQEIFWVREPLPSEFHLRGSIDLAPSDQTAESFVTGGWQSFPLQLLLQWRWDHDRENLLREEAFTERELAEALRKRQETRARLMETLTLESLASRQWLSSWTSGQELAAARACRELLEHLVSDLRATPKLTSASVKRRLKQAVQDLNRLNESTAFISTIQREDLMQAFEHVLCAARFPLLINQVELWRDW